MMYDNAVNINSSSYHYCKEQATHNDCGSGLLHAVCDHVDGSDALVLAHPPGVAVEVELLDACEPRVLVDHRSLHGGQLGLLLGEATPGLVDNSVLN